MERIKERGSTNLNHESTPETTQSITDSNSSIGKNFVQRLTCGQFILILIIIDIVTIVWNNLLTFVLIIIGNILVMIFLGKYHIRAPTFFRQKSGLSSHIPSSGSGFTVGSYGYERSYSPGITTSSKGPFPLGSRRKKPKRPSGY